MIHTIALKPIYYKDQNCIGIYFPVIFKLNSVIQKVPGCKWSKTNNCWVLACTKENFIALSNAVKCKAILETDELKKWLEEKKKDQPVTKTIVLAKPLPPLAKQQTKLPVPQKLNPITALSPENLVALTKMKHILELKMYSKSTIKTYCNELSAFLQLLQQKPAHSLTQEELQRYFLYCINILKLEENTIHSRMNALKFYYEQVLHREKMFFNIPRPKKPFLLPKLLNETELGKLFNALTNKKHKAMLFTAYSAGLRVSEIVNLRLVDIDSKRMQIIVCCAKGKKDRYVNLSPVLLDILRKYILAYIPRPKEYLFESEQTGCAYPIRTVQQIFTNAKNIAGIKKEVGIHSLRHSFATHLLEKGTDIKYIKDLLGHFNIKTTEKYLHVSRQKLVNIVSPLDDLMGREKIEW